MPNKNEGNLSNNENSITVSDLITILDFIFANQPVYVDKWNVFAKEKVKYRVVTNIFGNKTALKAEANLLIKNFGDRTTIYNIKANFIDGNKNQKTPATDFWINTNYCQKDGSIVLEKGDVISINIIAISRFQNKVETSISRTNLELIFYGTARSIKKIFPLCG